MAVMRPYSSFRFSIEPQSRETGVGAGVIWSCEEEPPQHCAQGKAFGEAEQVFYFGEYLQETHKAPWQLIMFFSTC